MNAPSPRIWLFWDNSNIIGGARQAALTREHPLDQRCVRIEFAHLFHLARAGREVGGKYSVGSSPELDRVWRNFRSKTGARLEVQERGRVSGAEQGVDQALQVWMLRTLTDVHPPGVAVLLTGDGAGYEDGAGFRADLERMHHAGWGVELLSWDANCNARLRSWVKTNGVYVPLEDHYRQITFIEGSRTASRPSLMNRPRA